MAAAEAAMRRVPAALLCVLMPFQRESVAFGLAHGGRTLIGDEMGLGKTVRRWPS